MPLTITKGVIHIDDEMREGRVEGLIKACPLPFRWL